MVRKVLEFQQVYCVPGGDYFALSSARRLARKVKCHRADDNAVSILDVEPSSGPVAHEIADVPVANPRVVQRHAAAATSGAGHERPYALMPERTRCNHHFFISEAASNHPCNAVNLRVCAFAPGSRRPEQNTRVRVQ